MAYLNNITRIPNLLQTPFAIFVIAVIWYTCTHSDSIFAYFTERVILQFALRSWYCLGKEYGKHANKFVLIIFFWNIWKSFMKFEWFSLSIC